MVDFKKVGEVELGRLVRLSKKKHRWAAADLGVRGYSQLLKNALELSNFFTVLTIFNHRTDNYDSPRSGRRDDFFTLLLLLMSPIWRNDDQIEFARSGSAIIHNEKVISVKCI